MKFKFTDRRTISGSKIFFEDKVSSFTVDLSGIMPRIKAVCLSGVENSASNTASVSGVRRSQRSRKKRTFDDEWIVDSEVSRRNSTKKSKKEVSSSVKTNITYNSVKSDLGKTSSIRKNGRLLLKKVKYYYTITKVVNI